MSTVQSRINGINTFGSFGNTHFDAKPTHTLPHGQVSARGRESLVFDAIFTDNYIQLELYLRKKFIDFYAINIDSLKYSRTIYNKFMTDYCVRQFTGIKRTNALNIAIIFKSSKCIKTLLWYIGVNEIDTHGKVPIDYCMIYNKDTTLRLTILNKTHIQVTNGTIVPHLGNMTDEELRYIFIMDTNIHLLKYFNFNDTNQIRIIKQYLDINRYNNAIDLEVFGCPLSIFIKRMISSPIAVSKKMALKQLLRFVEDIQESRI